MRNSWVFLVLLRDLQDLVNEFPDFRRWFDSHRSELFQLLCDRLSDCQRSFESLLERLGNNLMFAVLCSFVTATFLLGV